MNGLYDIKGIVRHGNFTNGYYGNYKGEYFQNVEDVFIVIMDEFIEELSLYDESVVRNYKLEEILN
jgi:hypothetical protein